MKRLFYILVLGVLLMVPLGAMAEDTQADSGQTDTHEAPAQEPPQAGSEGSESLGAAPEEMVQEEQGGDESAAEETPMREYLLEPDISTWLGYDFVTFDGAKRAGEFLWPHSSVIGGFKIHYSPLPSRLDTEFDYKNPYDYEAEFSYAYKDILKLNYMGWALWHNLDHLKPEAAVIDDQNPKAQYHVDVRDNKVFLRLKVPEMPYHFFVDYRHFEKEGTVQIKWYESFIGPTKGTRARDIDWITDKYVIGANGHFGPVEIEYNHLLKQFNPHGEVAPVDTFALGVRGVHSVVPQLETNADTVKIHTDMTGRIVASATFINGEKDNHHSNAEVEYRRAFGDVTLIPFKDVTIAIKYRYKELLESVPQVFGRSLPIITVPGALGITTDPIQTHTNHAEVDVRYAPFTNLGVKAEYSFENVKRYSADQWSDPEIFPFQTIPADQNTNRVKVGVNTRPLRSVSVIGSLEYAHTDHPAYPTKAENSLKGRVHADWAVSPEVTAGAYYRFTAENNDSADLSSRYDNAGGQVLWSPTPKTYFSAAYNYFRNKIARDLQLTLGDVANTPFPEERVPYRDSSHVYDLTAGYSLEIPLSFEVEFRQSWSKGMFRTRASVPGATTSGIGELADLRIRETGGAFTARYDFPKGWGASARYSVNNFEDFEDHPQDGPQDGTAHSVMLIVSKKW